MQVYALIQILISMQYQNTQELVQAAIDDELYHFIYDSYKASVVPDKFEVYSFKSEEEAGQFKIDALNTYAPDEPHPSLTYFHTENVPAFFEHIKEHQDYYFGNNEKSQLINTNISSELNSISKPDQTTKELVQAAIDKEEYHFVYDADDTVFSPDQFELFSFQTKEDAHQFMIDILDSYVTKNAPSDLTYAYAENISTFFKQIKKHQEDYFVQSKKTAHVNNNNISPELNSISVQDQNTRELLQTAIDNEFCHFVYDKHDAALSPDKLKLFSFQTEDDAYQFMAEIVKGYTIDKVADLTYSYAENTATFFEHIQKHQEEYLGKIEKNHLNNKNISSQLNSIIMEDQTTITEQSPMEKNLSYLETQLEILGFREDVKHNFLKEMEANKNEENFDVRVTQFYSTPLTKKDDPSTLGSAVYELHYNKDKREDRENRFFFLNSYDASAGKNKMKVYVSSDQKNFTAKEAFNLLEGRSVYKKDIVKKDQTKYNAWINFDFEHLNEKNQPTTNRYSDGFGFDVSAELKKLSLKENKYNDRHYQLVGSLEKGNLQAVTALVDGKEKPMFIEAKPQYKNFKLYEINEKNKLVPVKTDTITIKPTVAENMEGEGNKVEGEKVEGNTVEGEKAESKEAENNPAEAETVENKETRRTSRRR
jgi:hypothetical protein